MTSKKLTSDFIPLVDIKSQMAGIRAEVNSVIGAALDRCDFILGEDVGEFESDFATFCEVEHAIGCANGTDALSLGLRAVSSWEFCSTG